MLLPHMASSVHKKEIKDQSDSQFTSWITADGSTGFKAEAGRYHIYVSFACPFAHRALIVRKLKGLEDVVSVTFADVFKEEEKGWSFIESADTVNNCEYLRQIYLKARPGYSGRITIPCLWDKVKQTIVNNDSSDIMRMLNKEFNAFCPTEEQRGIDFYPENLRHEIDGLNEWIYPNINIGVYKCGFATSQEAYNSAVTNLFGHLDKVEGILSNRRYLTGSAVTEADIKLFTTLVRFDWVYHGLFKCNKKRLIEFPNLWGFVRDIYQSLDLGEIVNRKVITDHYYASMMHINPTGIIAVGPDLDLVEPHGRGSLSG